MLSYISDDVALFLHSWPTLCYLLRRKAECKTEAVDVLAFTWIFKQQIFLTFVLKIQSIII